MFLQLLKTLMIMWAWENIRENIKISAELLQQHKPWFD
jgi:hypothetical protein